MLRKTCIERVGLFDESIAYGLDYDMWIRLSKEFYFEYIERPLVMYSVHKDRTSFNPEIRNYFNLGPSLLGTNNFRRIKEFRNSDFKEKIREVFL